jgi:NDP-sugar pyrophosphorylase family protein
MNEHIIWEGRLMGTAGEFKCTANRFEGTFLVVMGDAVTAVGRLTSTDSNRLRR